jgi:hypothetical protein
MKVNRGGQLALDDIFGRDKFITGLWRELAQTSVVLTAERRTGKTCVIKKMHGSKQEGVLTFFQDLEGVYSTSELLEKVLQCVRPELSRGDRAVASFKKFFETLGGTEIAGVLRLPDAVQAEWKHVLPKILEKLLEHHPGNVIFFWDEFPQMLHNVAQERPEDAMAILDVLRAQRQHHPRLRFVFTGSIGFHSVLSYLQRRGYRNAPKNDMYTVLLPPLSTPDGIALARALLDGEAIKTDDPQGVAQEIAAQASCIPFYVHQIVGGMRDRPHVGLGTAEIIVEEGLRAAHDPWELRHYRTRIDHDYEGEDRTYALAVLDTLALCDAPLPFAELARRATARPGVVDEERLRAVLKQLTQDHYIAKSADESGYAFRTALIGRWWRLERDL